LLRASEKLLNKGIHPTTIAESFQRAASTAVTFLTEMATPVDLSDRESLLRAASTSLNSKIVSQYSSLLAPIAVDAVTRVIDPTIDNVNLNDIRIVKKVGGTIDDTELVDGLVMRQPVLRSAGGPSRVEKAKIGLIQFQLSPPKPDMENQIVVNDYRQMDKILKEERQYLLNMCKKIKKSGCNVLLIQKSILRDAVNDLALHFLAKLKIMVIKDIERDEVEFIAKVRDKKMDIDVCIYSLFFTSRLVVSPSPMSSPSLTTSLAMPTLLKNPNPLVPALSKSPACAMKAALCPSFVAVPTRLCSKNHTVPSTMLSVLCAVLSRKSF
jgi:T-complex protein 1 subunit delta